jgi:ubiquinone biosynthesis protein
MMTGSATQAPSPGSQQLPRRSRLGRQRHVVTVLTRHGFGLLVQRSPVPFPGRGRLVGRPESLVAALEELGTTFIKLGQILSTRSDLLSEDYITALSALQDRLPPVPFADVRTAILRELGGEPEELFARIDVTPLATASIGQVHAATLRDGTEVVVKVQKPGISQEVELDLAIMHDLAQLAASRLDLPLIRNLEETVEQFAEGLRNELDYMHEGRNADRLRRSFASDPRVRLPRVHWDLTSARVLTLDRLYGTKITNVDALIEQGIDRSRIANTMAELVMRQIFELGFFHADPHPGNYLVLPDGTIGILDFGLFGTLDSETRRELLLLLAAWVRGDAEGLAESLVALGMTTGGGQFKPLRDDMRRVLRRYQDARLEEVNLSAVVSDIFRLARRYHLVLRGDLALMAKTLAMHEGLGLAIDPQFRLVEVAQPYVETALRRMYTPHPDLRAVALNLGAMLDLSSNFPQRAQRLLGRLERGDLGVSVRPEGTDVLMRDLNRMVNRLSISILAAAFIVGLGLVLQIVENSHASFLILTIFASGLFAAGTLGLWLLISMYRSGRLR